MKPAIQQKKHIILHDKKINKMTHLTEGEKAPDFKAKDQNGNLVSVKDFKGKKVVLYFYPEDDTPTCTVEACNLRDNYNVLEKKGLVILGVSPDDEKKHKKFEQKYKLPFTLLADPGKKIVDEYGVWGEKNLYGRKYMGLHRTTFLIDEKGIIQKIFRKPKSKIHSEEILKALD
jgi:peroxiredoxin Q/BCP